VLFLGSFSDVLQGSWRQVRVATHVPGGGSVPVCLVHHRWGPVGAGGGNAYNGLSTRMMVYVLTGRDGHSQRLTSHRVSTRM
jgi:hypothetical protein